MQNIPVELANHIFSQLSQEDLHSSLLVCRTWFAACLRHLYAFPRLTAKNYDRFIDTICSEASNKAHGKRTELASFVRELDLSPVLRCGGKTKTNRLLARTKYNLIYLNLGQPGLGLGAYGSLSKCSMLQSLDLSQTAANFDLNGLFKSIRHLESLEYLSLPRHVRIVGARPRSKGSTGIWSQSGYWWVSGRGTEVETSQYALPVNLTNLNLANMAHNEYLPYLLPTKCPRRYPPIPPTATDCSSGTLNSNRSCKISNLALQGRYFDVDITPITQILETLRSQLISLSMGYRRQTYNISATDLDRMVGLELGDVTFHPPDPALFPPRSITSEIEKDLPFRIGHELSPLPVLRTLDISYDYLEYELTRRLRNKNGLFPDWQGLEHCTSWAERGVLDWSGLLGPEKMVLNFPSLVTLHLDQGNVRMTNGPKAPDLVVPCLWAAVRHGMLLPKLRTIKIKKELGVAWGIIPCPSSGRASDVEADRQERRNIHARTVSDVASLDQHLKHLARLEWQAHDDNYSTRDESTLSDDDEAGVEFIGGMGTDVYTPTNIYWGYR